MRAAQQLIRVCLEGPPLDQFDVTKYIENWWGKLVEEPKGNDAPHEKNKQKLRSNRHIV